MAQWLRRILAATATCQPLPLARSALCPPICICTPLDAMRECEASAAAADDEFGDTSPVDHRPINGNNAQDSHGAAAYPASGAGAGAGAATIAPGASHRRSKVCLADFELLSMIGEGNYATVLLVQHKRTRRHYAMKVLRKAALIARDEVTHTLTERFILAHARHPFLVRMHAAFQTPTAVYLAMQFANGGELFNHLNRAGRFDEPRARFYAAEIVLALEYLHAHGVVYRDLKPENVLLDGEGHVALADFGLSKVLPAPGDETGTFCGTPEYLAPEVVLNRGHGKPVDWWSLGVLVYELLVGIPPFYDAEVAVMYRNILTNAIRIPPSVSATAADFLRRLLERDPARRLGSPGTKGAAGVKAHAFFRGVDWQAVLERRVPPPVVPAVSGGGDLSAVSPEFTRKPIPPDILQDLRSSGAGVGAGPNRGAAGGAAAGSRGGDGGGAAAAGPRSKGPGGMSKGSMAAARSDPFVNFTYDPAATSPGGSGRPIARSDLETPPPSVRDSFSRRGSPRGSHQERYRERSAAEAARGDSGMSGGVSRDGFSRGESESARARGRDWDQSRGSISARGSRRLLLSDGGEEFPGTPMDGADTPTVYKTSEADRGGRA
eukprot:TRINITY_DN728_c0_g1_i1.p1 TRINITY_DN728_c0_g1~~TRINITY_DN728_c0_g1_i1.p1  ORF type:complete len:607 (-),score=90.06 TRINITY_DN728_c0_g1_i1:39-1859(-)